MRTIAAATDAELAVEDMGNPDGPVLMFVHGFSSWRGEWYTTVSPAITNHFRCLLVDLPGCGDSSEANDANTIPAFAAAVIAAADALGVASFTFVGHALGGACLPVASVCACAPKS